jgi:class 3 adenylate cyclase/pimeloyl-ACP methyl ester carboxylesterase
MSLRPATQYTRSDDHYIAYQVFGRGRIDLVIVPGFISHLEHQWEDPELARFLERLATFSRVIIFDKRGTGMSDRDSFALTLEERMADMLAVMEAVNSKQAALFGISEGGPMSILFAATYPEKTSALIIYGSWAKGARSEDYPWTLRKEQFERWINNITQDWGDPDSLVYWAPSAAHDEVRKQWWGKLLRLGASPGAAINLIRTFYEMDVRSVLPSIQVPTLVLHRRDDQTVRVGNGRYLADHIPEARYVELEGIDHLWWINEEGTISSEIEEFLTGVRPVANLDRTLATVLFTDIVNSTAKALELGDYRWRTLLERHNQLVRQEIKQYRGREVRHTGDGFFVTFQGPSQAIHCAQAIKEAMKELDIEIRAGIHTGEVELIEGEIGGVAIHLAARIVDMAGPNEILSSGTVKDLVVGSGIEFSDCGQHQLKGIPGQWHLYRVLATPSPG